MITRRFMSMWRGWDTPTQLGVVLAVAALLVALGVWQFGDAVWRTGAIVGAALAWLVLQLLVLWGNRGMVTPLNRAQQAYLKGDFAGVEATLLPHIESGEVAVAERVLLGNAYRQDGDLANSLTMLEAAVDLEPESHFALYGLGRTLLAQGDFARAVDVLVAAVEAGAPEVVRLDVAEALWCVGQGDEMRAWLEVEPEEAHRQVMRQYLLGQRITGSVLAEGLPYWEEMARRFRETAYGMRLGEMVQGIEREIQS